MLKILDNFSERIINIIHMLFKSDGKIHIDNILNSLDISDKTLYDDFRFINENWGHIIEINFSESEEICAPKMSMSTFLELQSIILLDTVSIKILKSIFFYPYQKLSFHINRLHLSSSTFYKYIHLINDYLDEYEMTIENNQSCYHISSPNELRLRRFFTTFFLQVSGYSSKMFLDTEMNLFLKERIATLYKKNGHEITSIMLSYYADLYYFSLIREEQGFRLTPPKNFLGNWVNLSDEEHKFFNEHFKNITITNIKNVECFILVHHHKFTSYTDNNLDKAIPNFLNNIVKIFKLDTMEKKDTFVIDFLKDLYLSESFMKVPLHLVTNKYIYFTNEASKNNSWVIYKLKYLISKLSDETGIDFNYHEDFIIYNIIIHLPEIMENRLTQHILIISDNSKAHAEFLCERIQTELNLAPSSSQHVKCIYKEDLVMIDIHSYDLIITNSIPINEKIESILINSFPTFADLQKIKKNLI